MCSRTVFTCLLLLGPVVAVAAPRQLAVDKENSSVNFKVRATLHSFTGTATEWNAQVVFPEGSDLPEQAKFTASVAGMQTGDEKRDRDMHEWLNAEKFPEIEFDLEALKQEGEAYQATGKLMLHGEAKPVTIPVTFEQTGNAFSVSGEVTIDHREYGLKKYRKFGLLTVNPEVDVTFTLVGKVQ